MEAPVDNVSIAIFAFIFIFAACLIAWAEWQKLRDDRRLDAESERREKEAKDYWEKK